MDKQLDFKLWSFSIIRTRTGVCIQQTEHGNLDNPLRIPTPEMVGMDCGELKEGILTFNKTHENGDRMLCIRQINKEVIYG
jgi:hypothetical protein